MMLAQTLSVYMTTGMSIHRFIGVCLPFKAVSLLQTNKIRLFISVLVGFSVLFNTTRFFEIRFANDCFRKNIGAYIPVILPTELRFNATYQKFFFGWAYTIIMFVMPFSILILVNLQVLVALRRSNRLHFHRESTDENTKRMERKERQTSIMLIFIVIIFLICNTLAFVCNILENVGFDRSAPEIFTLLVMYNNFVVLINASCNIAIYMLFSKKYRMLLRHYTQCARSHKGELLLATTAWTNQI